MVPFTQGPGADGLDVEVEWSEKRGECGSPVGEALEQRTATEPHKERPPTLLRPNHISTTITTIKYISTATTKFREIKEEYDK